MKKSLKFRVQTIIKIPFKVTSLYQKKINNNYQLPLKIKHTIYKISNNQMNMKLIIKKKGLKNNYKKKFQNLKQENQEWIHQQNKKLNDNKTETRGVLKFIHRYNLVKTIRSSKFALKNQKIKKFRNIY